MIELVNLRGNTLPEMVNNIQVIQGAEYAKTFGILDPRPFAENHPYTYGLPKKECLDAIGMGDIIHVRVHRPEKDYGQQAWFEVLSATPDDIEGRMKYVPYGWPAPASDVVLKFAKFAVADVTFADPKHQPLAELPSKKYTGWCLMDGAIRFPDCKVRHIFREDPKMLYEDDPNDESDTGWRLSAAGLRYGTRRLSSWIYALHSTAMTPGLTISMNP
jgi:hypothetical protein